jgi:hypothetical protein
MLEAKVGPSRSKAALGKKRPYPKKITRAKKG